ncbi:MAG TPA: oligosaccharide flippase family protein [bacterium]
MIDSQSPSPELNAQDRPTAAANGTSLSQKAAIIVFSRAVTITTQMLSLVILTRVLSKENFGLLSFLLLGYSTVVTLAQLGLPESIFYFFERVPVTARKSLALLTGKALLLTGLGASVILIAMNFLAPVWGFAVNGLFFPFILMAFLELPTLVLPNLLLAIHRAKDAAWFNVIVGILQFTAMVVPALLGHPLSVIVAALMGYSVLRFAISALLFLRHFKGSPEPLPKGLLREQFHYSIPLGISQILWGLNRQIDKYVVAAFLPVAVYSEYVVGSWEIPLLPAIAYSVASVMMPQLVSFHLKGQKTELLRLWNKSIEKVSIIVLPLVLLFMVAAEELITVFFSEKYLAAVVPFRIYTLIILQRVAAYSSMLKAVGETRVIFSTAVYLLVINLVLSVPLVVWLGMAGPPLAALAANMFTWWYALDKIKRCHGVSMAAVFPFGVYLRALAVSVVAALPIVLLKDQWQLLTGVKLAAIVSSYLVLYVIAAHIAGVARISDWSYYLRTLRPGPS